jgi:hypothetical protein
VTFLRRTLRTLAVALLTLAGLSAEVPAQGVGGGKTKSEALKTKVADPKTDAEREAAALGFVREHHPELAALLAELKPMRPDEYAKAVEELARVSRSLNNLKARDPRRYAVGLDVWKCRSRVEVITARLASEPSPELESQLRQAVAAQLDAQTRQQRFERDQVAERLRRLDENLRKLESDPAAVVEARVQALLKKSRVVRRPQAAARPRPNKTTNESAKKGERQP